MSWSPLIIIIEKFNSWKIENNQTENANTIDWIGPMETAVSHLILQSFFFG